MQIFVNYIRPCYAVYDDEDSIFIKDDGKQFPKGTIGRRVKEFFRRAGIHSDISVSATKIRQIHSNEASELSPKKQKAIASHMKHQTKTADADYVLKVNAEKAGRAHELVGKIIQETLHTEDEKVADWDEPKKVKRKGTKEEDNDDSREREREDDEVEDKEDHSNHEGKNEDEHGEDRDKNSNLESDED